jgi:hypothetical protein
MPFGERQEMEQKLGLEPSLVRVQVPQGWQQAFEFTGGETHCNGTVLGWTNRLFSGCVPPAHVRDLGGDMSGSLGQIGGDVLASVSRIHRPGREDRRSLVG